MSKTKLIVSLAVGSIFGLLTVLLMEHPELPEGVGTFAIFLMLGFIAGMVAGNVHNPAIWASTFGNFLFYFLATYFVMTLFERYG